VQRLLQQPADPSSPAGYSLVDVHVWSHNVSDVVMVAAMLEAAAPGRFDIVTPDVFVQRIIDNLAPLAR